MKKFIVLVSTIALTLSVFGMSKAPEGGCCGSEACAEKKAACAKDKAACAEKKAACATEKAACAEEKAACATEKAADAKKACPMSE